MDDMNSASIKHTLLQKLQENELSAIKGASLSLKLPLHESFLNTALQELISTNENFSDFNSIRLYDLNHDELVVDVDHSKIKRSFRCRIQEMDYNRSGDPMLIIAFLEGIRFYERALLASVMSVKKGWTWFKSKMKGKENTVPPFKVTGSELVVNLGEVLRQQDLGFLIPFLGWEGIYTYENKLIIRLNFKV